LEPILDVGPAILSRAEEEEICATADDEALDPGADSCTSAAPSGEEGAGARVGAVARDGDEAEAEVDAARWQQNASDPAERIGLRLRTLSDEELAMVLMRS